MHLSWQQQERIAEALAATYPDQDRLALALEDLRLLIVALPDFKDTPQPPGDAWLHKILWTWMRLADAGADVGGDTDCTSPPCSLHIVGRGG